MICNLGVTEEEFARIVEAESDGLAIFEYKDGKPTGKKMVFKPVSVSQGIHKSNKSDSKKQENSAVTPSYYGGADNAYEAIKVIDAWGLGFALGNAIKYICRAGKKKDNSRLQDLEKAQYYIGHEIKCEKGEVR